MLFLILPSTIKQDSVGGIAFTQADIVLKADKALPLRSLQFGGECDQSVQS